MIEHLSDQERLAVVRAVNHMKATCPEQMKIFQDALEAELRSLDPILREAEGTALHQTQGHAQRLHGISEYLAGSRELQRTLIDRIRQEGNTRS